MVEIQRWAASHATGVAWVLYIAWCVAVVVFIGPVIATLVDYIKEKKDKK